MIAQIRGLLAHKNADRIIVDVHGLGYEVLIPFSTYYELGNKGEEVSLYVHTHVREDTLCLFGFHSMQEKQLFLQLIQISGIGPKLAVAILSGLPVDQFAGAVARADIARLSSIPGVGKKTAERIALEMKDKVAALLPEDELLQEGGPASALQGDVVSALVNLGYPKHKAETVVSKAVRGQDDGDFQGLLKRALKELAG